MQACVREGKEVSSVTDRMEADEIDVDDEETENFFATGENE